MRTDVLIAGGGLAGSLIALALAARRPEVAVTIAEVGPRFGGNHIWSFFDTDVAAADRAIVEALICHRWSAYDVRFPGRTRTLPVGYNSIESERLDEAVRATLPMDRLLTGAFVATLDPAGATLGDGRRIDAGTVIDARGFPASPSLRLGWQKFVGQLLRLHAPHGLDRPVIMDATVNQADGYRFVYLLPFGPDRVFVEDTYYTNGGELDVPLLRGRIDAYADAKGWRIAAIEREEAAALPIVLGGGPRNELRDSEQAVGKAGMVAGLFNPMTGYSLPDAVRTAALVAGLADLSTTAVAQALNAQAAAAWKARGFYRLLARMLLLAADPPERWRVLARFYRLDPDLVARFYAAHSTPWDKLRILAGKPPVPLVRALAVLRESWM